MLNFIAGLKIETKATYSHTPFKICQSVACPYHLTVQTTVFQQVNRAVNVTVCGVIELKTEKKY